LTNVQLDELVRDNAELLQRKSLHFSAWEALDEVRVIVGLALFNFSLKKLDHNLVVDYTRQIGKLQQI